MSISLHAAGTALPLGRAPARRGRRCAARFDEDAVTLAAEAALEALAEAPGPPAAVILASTSAPYDEGGSAQILVELLGLPADTFVLDLGASPRDGLAALRLADGLVATGVEPVLVCAAHRRRDDGDGDSGDGAVALVVDGGGGGMATIVPGPSHAEELRERWRMPGDVTPQEADASFVEEFGAARVARLVAERAAASAPAHAGTAGSGAEPLPVLVAGPGIRAAQRLERALGGPGDEAVVRTGVLGAAHAPLRILMGLDAPSVVVAASGGLADAVHVDPSDEAARLAERVRAEAAGGDDVPAPPAVPGQEGFLPYASVPRAWRERGQDLRLEGTEQDGRVLYPPPPAASGEPRRLAREGTVLTFTRDHVYPGADGVTMAVTTLDDGTRFYGQVVDGETVAIGDRIRLVPRRLHAGGGFVQYFWKVMPCR